MNMNKFYAIATFNYAKEENIANIDSEFMSVNAKRIVQLVKFINEDRVLKKAIYEYSWLSGGSTTVYPITIFRTGDIDVQLKGGRRMNDYMLRGVIKRIKEKFSDIVYDCGSDAEFYDGSCPVSFKIYLHNHTIAQSNMKEVA